MLIAGRQHLLAVLEDYAAHYSLHRPHRTLNLRNRAAITYTKHEDRELIQEAAGQNRRLPHTNRYATVLTCSSFLLPLGRGRRAATARATGSSR